MAYLDLRDPSIYQEHIREFNDGGRIRRIAEFDASLDYKIVKLGKKWVHGIVPNAYRSRMLIELNETTKSCEQWHSYEFTGKVVIEVTYGNYHRAWLYPHKIEEIPNLRV